MEAAAGGGGGAQGAFRHASSMLAPLAGMQLQLLTLTLLAAYNYAGLRLIFGSHSGPGLSLPAVPVHTTSWLLYMAMACHAASTMGWRRAFTLWSVGGLVSFALELLAVHRGLIFGAFRHHATFGTPVLGVSPIVPFTYSALCYMALTAAARAVVDTRLCGPLPRDVVRAGGLKLMLRTVGILLAFDAVFDGLCCTEGLAIFDHLAAGGSAASFVPAPDWEFAPDQAQTPLGSTWRNLQGWLVTCTLIVGLFGHLDRDGPWLRRTRVPRPPQVGTEPPRRPFGRAFAAFYENLPWLHLFAIGVTFATVHGLRAELRLVGGLFALTGFAVSLAWSVRGAAAAAARRNAAGRPPAARRRDGERVHQD